MLPKEEKYPEAGIKIERISNLNKIFVGEKVRANSENRKLGSRTEVKISYCEIF